jgi:predicted Fe-Mo cluster-binding NifX family protein
MKIAIASEGINVSGHFGHCEGFLVYEVENNEIKGKEFLKNPGHKPGFLPKFLKEQNVNVIVSGGMGGSAQTLFANQNIDVIVGASGNTEDVIRAYVNETLKSTSSVCHDHQHQGDCNNH